ncbi:hypothetical protein RAA17_12260 [Komagataeibacter rhaeticus]|nr:hypothetical protein [Komagataeibacter rhaeticus]
MMAREFNTLDGFIRHLRDRVVPNISHAVHRGVQDGADLIKTETKVQIGQYLDGPESGLPTAPWRTGP